MRNCCFFPNEHIQWFLSASKRRPRHWKVKAWGLLKPHIPQVTGLIWREVSELLTRPRAHGIWDSYPQSWDVGISIAEVYRQNMILYNRIVTIPRLRTHPSLEIWEKLSASASLHIKTKSLSLHCVGVVWFIVSKIDSWTASLCAQRFFSNHK